MQEKTLAKAKEPIDKRHIEYEEKLKTWCNNNGVVFRENIMQTSEMWVNNRPGYIWFDNKDFVFCPDAINCGTPINIDEGITFIKYENIKYYSKDGSISYTKNQKSKS